MLSLAVFAPWCWTDATLNKLDAADDYIGLNFGT